MKTRAGWVSNSSSSSFVCQVCGEECGGFDMSMSECGMVECENGHVICEGHQKKGVSYTPEQKKEKMLESYRDTLEYLHGDTYYSPQQRDERIKRYQGWFAEVEAMSGVALEEYFEYGEGSDWWYDYEADSGFGAELCPICQFEVGRPQDMLAMVLFETGDTRDAILERIRNQFSSYGEARAAWRGKAND